ncbi:MAG: hypothetical protein ACI93R_004273 [Flavobacteriales bacterium]|jgi:hypothetical protein
MNDINEYLGRANEIIGPRTRDEELYDDEVVKCLKKYGKIRKALNRANKKYPAEALDYDEESLGELEERYEYMVSHYDIVKQIGN